MKHEYKNIKIGVLAVQGAFIEHEQMIRDLGASCVEIRQKKDLAEIDGIILPGGESTVQGQLLRKLDLFSPLQEMIQNGLPVLATCAGLILLAEEIENDPVRHLATLPVTVKRNAYGRQLGSFSDEYPMAEIGSFPMTFIRAPYIARTAPDVTVLASVQDNIVAVRWHDQIGLAFHPELTGDTRIHEYFLSTVENHISSLQSDNGIMHGAAC